MLIDEKFVALPDLTGHDAVTGWLLFQEYTHIHHNKLGWSPARWLLDHALPKQDFAPLPRLRRGRPKRCFWNSLQLVRKSPKRYVYCEGYAKNIIPCEHAWCIDRTTGLVVDKTWDRGSDYIGVPVKADYAFRCLEKEHSAVWDWQNDYPIMQGKVPEAEWRETI